MKFTRRMVFQSVIETVVGTDPGSGYTAILTNVGTEIQGVGDIIKRDVVRQTFSPMAHVIGAKQFNFTVPVEMKGNGVTGSAPNVPEIDTLLQACALQKSDGAVINVDNYDGTPAFAIGEVVEKTVGGADIGTLIDIVTGAGNTATLYLRNVTIANLPADNDSVTGVTSGATGDTVGTPTQAFCYRPVTDRDLMKSLTIHYNHDGIRHVATGCRGTFTLDASVGQYPKLQFTLQGTFALPTDVSLPTVSYSTVIPPVCFNAGLAMGTLDMTKTAVTQVTLDLANTLVPRNDINAAEGRLGFEITAREPKGTLNPELMSVADYAAWSLWRDATPGKIYCQFGSAAGNRWRVLVPAAVYSEVTYQDRDGIAATNLPFICQEGTDGTVGDNELYLMVF